MLSFNWFWAIWAWLDLDNANKQKFIAHKRMQLLLQLLIS